MDFPIPFVDPVITAIFRLSEYDMFPNTVGCNLWMVSN